MKRALGYHDLVLLTGVEPTCFTPGVVLTGALKPGVYHFSGAQHCPSRTESKSFRLGSPVCPRHKFWHRLQSLACQHLPRQQRRLSALLSRLSLLCPSHPEDLGKHKGSSSFAHLRVAASHNKVWSSGEQPASGVTPRSESSPLPRDSPSQACVASTRSTFLTS